jgi:hypothetical protein
VTALWLRHSVTPGIAAASRGRILEDHGDGTDGTDTRARAKKYVRHGGRFKEYCVVVSENPLSITNYVMLTG